MKNLKSTGYFVFCLDEDRYVPASRTVFPTEEAAKIYAGARKALIVSRNEIFGLLQNERFDFDERYEIITHMDRTKGLVIRRSHHTKMLHVTYPDGRIEEMSWLGFREIVDRFVNNLALLRTSKHIVRGEQCNLETSLGIFHLEPLKEKK